MDHKTNKVEENINIMWKEIEYIKVSQMKLLEIINKISKIKSTHWMELISGCALQKKD